MRQSSFIILIISMLVGLSLSAVSAWYTHSLHQQKIIAQFKVDVDARAFMIKQEVDLNLEALYALKAFMDASSFTSRKQFHIIASEQRERHPDIQALEWVPRVPEISRHKIESLAIKEGFSNFVITERGPQKKLVKAATRPEYFPVYYVEPMAGNEAAFGFDLASNNSRRQSLEQSRDSGEPRATARIKLVQRNGSRFGFLIFLPVYTENPDNVSERRKQLKGFALGVYIIDEIYEKALQPVAKGNDDIAITMVDVTDITEESILYKYTPRSGSITNIEYQKSLGDVAGRKWKLRASPTTNYLHVRSSVLPFVIFFSGLLLTLLLTRYLGNILKQSAGVADALAQSEELNRLMLKSAGEGIYGLNLQGKTTFVNPAVCNMLGYEEYELLGQPMHKLIHHSYPDGSHYPREKCPMYQAFTDGQVHRITTDVLWKKDGSSIPIEYTSTPIIQNGTIAGAVVTFNDITQRLIAEQSIITEKTRLKAVIDNVVDGIITISDQGSIEAFNPSAEKIFGFSSSEVLGKNIKILMPEPFHSEHDSYLAHHIATGEKKVIGIGREVVGQRKDGSTFPMDLAVSALHTGGVKRFVGIIRDISERKRIDQMKAEFISTVSHELRTPLTSIRGALGLILGGVAGELPEKAQSLLDIANKNSERLILLINDILDIEKIEAGKMQFDFNAIDLSSVIESSIEANRAYGEQFHVRFTLNIKTDGDLLVKADEKRLLQVLANLLSNAAKYSPKEDTVEITLERSNGNIRIGVHDNGKGIPDGFRSRVFSKFSQADSSDTRAKGGTGLGLSISKAIIEEHNGSIGFESCSEGGTTFYVDLPECHTSTGEEDDSLPLASA